MATPSSVLAWKIPRTEEPGGLWPRGSQRLQRTQVRQLSTHAGFTQSWRRLRRMHTSCAYPWKTLRTGTQAVVLGRQDFSSFPLSSVLLECFTRSWFRNLRAGAPGSWGRGCIPYSPQNLGQVMFTPLSLNFLICKPEVMIPPPQSYCEDEIR